MSEDRQLFHLPCHVGCLRHVVGVTYFNWREGDPDEPELYFETLHEPCEGFWMRLWRAWQFVVQKKPIGVDSTLIGTESAKQLCQFLMDYAIEHNKWRDATALQQQEQK